MSLIWDQLVRRVRKMPSDSLTVAVTAGLGFSVIAGIVTGVCYILTYGLPRNRHRKVLTPWQCSVCGGHFRSIEGVLEVEKVATCARCGAKVCREKCSTKDLKEGWICRACRPDNWFATLLNVLHPTTNKGWNGSRKMNQTAIDEIDEDLLELQKKEREQVRDFIERLVGALLGGDLDNVSVKKLYNDAKYEAIFTRYHHDMSNALTDLGSALHITIANLPISGQSPCSAHATLKLLIQRFIQEATELPKLQKFHDNPAIPDDTSDRTYEDLLSTAIINKVIQNNQDGAPSRSLSSRTSSRRRGGKEYYFGERNLDHRKVPDDASSLSSLDSDTVSLKLRGCIKEVSSSGDETKDEDEVDTKRSVEWQDNWRLQKRKYNTGTSSPVPVPMLVPDPITDAKVLIGDREADDTTDLSDAASDFEEALEPSSLNAVLVNSRTVIGGRNPLESIVSKAESISEDGSTDDSDLIQEREDIVKQLNDVDETDIVETSNDLLIDQKGAEEVSLISLDSNTEKDLEYTERYASLPRTIYKSPKPAPRQSKIDHKETSLEDDLKTDNVDSGVTSDEDEKQKTFKGTYGEREKDKWNHAVPLSNNPYSQTNLENRLSNRSSNSSIGSGFGRDYYIREAAKSAGARKQASLEDEVENEDTNETIVPQTRSNEPLKPIEEPAIVPKLDNAVFKALPAIVQEDVESSLEPSTPTRPNILDFSSDSDYSIERTYNLNSGEVLRKTPHEENLKGIRYLPKDFDVDENHNKLKMQDSKRKFLRSLTIDHDDDDNFDVALENDRNSSSLTESFDEVVPPLINHFKLVEEIANETSDQYDQPPISPPAEYRTNDSPLISINDNNFEIPTKQIEDQNVVQCAISTPNNSITNGCDSSATSPEEATSMKDFSLTFSEVSEPEAEICDLNEKKLVKNRLGEFSKSFPTLPGAPRLSKQLASSSCSDVTITEVEDDDLPSVKTLSKIFDSSSAGKKEQVYSLTARSIPRQFRQELKKDSTPILPEDTREIISSEPSPDDKSLPFPKAKSKIEFFERLRM